MKRLITTAAVVALLAVLGPSTVKSASQCDPHRSSLCTGLLAWYDFEEDSDYTRVDSLMGGLLMEADVQDVGRDGTNKKLGSYSADVTNGRFSIPYASIGSGNWTVCVWFKDNSNTARNILVARDDDSHGTRFYVDSNDKPNISVSSSPAGRGQVDTDNNIHTTAVTSGGWSLVCAAHTTENLKRGETIMIGLNGVWNRDTIGTDTPFDTWGSPVASFPTGSAGMLIGNGDGNTVQLDGLGFWSRALSDEEIADLYNSGTGLNFPFY